MHGYTIQPSSQSRVLLSNSYHNTFLVIISIFSVAFLPMMLNGKIILNSGDAVVYGADIANNERDRKEIETQSDGDTELYVWRNEDR